MARALGFGHALALGLLVPEPSRVEDGAWLGPRRVVTNDRYPLGPCRSELEGVHIGARAMIAAGALLLPGIVIGAHATIGVSAMVTQDVVDRARIAGNPGPSL